MCEHRVRELPACFEILPEKTEGVFEECPES